MSISVNDLQSAIVVNKRCEFVCHGQSVVSLKKKFKKVCKLHPVVVTLGRVASILGKTCSKLAFKSAMKYIRK